MHLTLSGARADGAPANKISDVLRRNGVEQLRTGGEPNAIDIGEELPADAQPVVDAKTFIESRIVDETFPADGCPRFFKINTHHDFKGVGKSITFGAQFVRIL